MWTIMWTDENENDHYERFDSKNDLLYYIREMGLTDDEDALVFPPEADELATSPAWM